MFAYLLEVYKLKHICDRENPGEWIYLQGFDIEADDLSEAIEKSEELLKKEGLVGEYILWQVGRTNNEFDPNELPF